MSELPETILIGAIHYRVEEIEDLHSNDEDGYKKLNGHIVYNSAEIRVEADMADDVKLATIWHEAVHGLLDQAGITDHPEQAVVALGYGLLRLLRDNPQLIAKTMNATIMSPPVPVSIGPGADGKLTVFISGAEIVNGETEKDESVGG